MPEHRTSPLMYAVIFGALLLLTLLTVLASYFQLGVWTVPVALGIAAAKATLVALFFMHLLHSSRLSWLVVAAGLFWLGIMLALTFSDYLSRSWQPY
jgi:cytochrome c oxidase subunit IV